MTVDDIFEMDPNASARLNQFYLAHLLGQQVEFEEPCCRKGMSDEMAKKDLPNTHYKGHLQPRISHVSLDQVIDFLHLNQHAFIKELIKKVDATLNKVIAQYGTKRKEVVKIKGAFDHIKEGLEIHMYTEGMILFPAIQNIVNRSKGQPQEEIKSFRLQYPIEVMKVEHENIFQSMRDIKTASRNFKVPKNSSPSFNELYLQLQRLNNALKKIVHIENNILYPFALRVEKETSVSDET